MALICFTFNVRLVVLLTISLQARDMHADIARANQTDVSAQLKALSHTRMLDHIGRDVREMGSIWKLAQPVCAWLS